MRVYLAGPFFNRHQSELVERVRDALVEDFHVFSPMHDSDKGTTKQIFKSNVNAIRSSDAMIAITEYRGVQLLALDWVDDENRGKKNATVIARIEDEERQFEAGASVVMLPDIGTVWEMGYAYALNKPIVFLNSGPVGNWNIMLSECAHVECATTNQLINKLKNMAKGMMY